MTIDLRAAYYWPKIKGLATPDPVGIRMDAADVRAAIKTAGTEAHRRKKTGRRGAVSEVHGARAKLKRPPRPYIISCLTCKESGRKFTRPADT